MSTLISIRHNPLYTKKEGSEELERHDEIILLVDMPEYILNNAGEIIRSRGIKDLRFSVSKENLTALIDSLNIIKESYEK